MKKRKLNLRRGWEALIDALYPRRCFLCDRLLAPAEYAAGIHELCRPKLYPIRGDVCMHCGAPVAKGHEYCENCSHETSSFDQGKALFLYKGSIKKSMYRFKYSGKQEYARAYAAAAVAAYGDWILQQHIDFILPVPMYRKKQRERGYNQAEIFARALARELEETRGISLPVRPDLIVRKIPTTPMKNLNKKERYNNLKNAFQMRGNVLLYGKIALVVDDIYTTGATANAVSYVLQQAGMEKTFCLSVCIGRGL